MAKRKAPVVKKKKKKVSKFPGMTFLPREDHVKELGFKTVPTGDYEVELLEAPIYHESSEKKTPGIRWPLGVVNAEDDEHNGARPWHWTALGSNFMWNVILAFVSPDDWGELEGVEIDIDEIKSGDWELINECVGNTTEVEITLEVRDGKESNNIKSFVLPEDLEEEDDEEEEEELGDDLVQRLREYRRYKEAASTLREIEEMGLRAYPRLAPPPQLPLPTGLDGVTVELGPTAFDAAVEELRRLMGA